MIAKGNLHGDGGFLAQYLITGDENETAELLETRGLEFLGNDPVQAFEMLQRIADANTQSTKPFFHIQTRLAPDEHLTNAQWLQVFDREEKRLGLTGQPRIVSFHIDKETGEKHGHVALFRIDLETMRAIDSGLYKNHLKHLCRTLEKEYGLREVSNIRQPHDVARLADRNEVEEARRLGMDVRDVRNTILGCIDRADSGKAFRAALDEHGLILANGDRRDCFVVVDPAGGQHALNKKLTGLTLAAMRDRLSDLDRTELPSVEQAKEQQHQKYPTPESAREAWDLSQDRLRNMAGRYDPLRPEQQQQELGRLQPQPPRDERPETRHPAYSPEPSTSRPEPAAAATKGQEQERPPASPQPERWHNRNATKAEGQIFHIQEAAERGGPTVAAGLHAEGLTLARVDAAGIVKVDSVLRRQHENAVLQGKLKPGAKVRQATFKEGELVLVNRYGDVHRLNPRFIDNDKLERAATVGTGTTPSLSSALTHFADRSPQNRPPRTGKESDHTPQPFVGKPRGGAGPKVNVKGAVVALSSFIESLFGMGAAPSSLDQQQQAPQTGGGADHPDHWEEIFEATQKGRSLSEDFVRHLPPAELENLHRLGDAGINNKIMDMQIAKAREEARSWDDYERGGRELEH